MKSITITIIALFLFSNICFSQITKTNWMVGGNAGFSFSNPNNGDFGNKVTIVTIAPNIGYFFVDKFAAGLRLSYQKTHITFVQQSGGFNNATDYSIGPFVRYYFLSVDQQYNIISEGSFQFGNEVETNSSYTNKLSTNSFTFSAGPVIYFNSSVGLEFLLSYTSGSTSSSSGNRSNSFTAEIGLQVYLEKDKN